MIIGIEAERGNNPQKTGVEHYAKQLILHLAAIDKASSYILYLRTEPQDWLKALPANFKLKVIPFPIFWTQLRISWEMLFNRIDVLFIPASALPIFHPKNSVVTIHDLAWKFYPDSFTWFNRNFLEWSTRFAVKRAAKVIAVSESTKKDIIKFYKVDAEKIVVIHHGYESVGAGLGRPLAMTGEQALPLQQPYILFLSTLQPRKNLVSLIKAFKLFKQEHPELPHKLVVVGKHGWKFGPILKAINENSDIVAYLNYVPDGDRLLVLKGSSLLVLPSFYEGFGMQILEAFSLGVPVATSNISSMPEVGGEAAIYFNPNNIAEIKNAIKDVLLDKSLADALRQKGTERLKNFSWQKCAEETLAVMTKMNKN